MNLNKKCKICAQCDECDRFSSEGNFFHRYQQNGVKKNFQRYQDAVKKILPLKLQILQIFTAKFNAYLKFTWSSIEESDRWRSGIRSCWHVGGERTEPVSGSFFCKKSGELFHRYIPQILQNFISFNGKTCGHFAVKRAFHRYSPLILHFYYQTLNRSLILKLVNSLGRPD